MGNIERYAEGLQRTGEDEGPWLMAASCSEKTQPRIESDIDFSALCALKAQGSIPAWARILFGSNHTSDFKIGTPGYPARQLALKSALGLIGLVSGYCYWMMEKVRSATSISVWQHVHLSEQILP